jgi:cytochrome c553
MKPSIVILAALSAFALALPAQAAGNAQAGKAKASGCVGCHGAKGEGVAPNPALAGKSEDDMVQALKDYKSGKRANATMKAMAGTLKEPEMADVAAYFSSLKK